MKLSHLLMLTSLAAIITFGTGCSSLDRLLDPQDSGRSHTLPQVTPADAPRLVTGKVIGDPTRFILLDGVETAPLTLTVQVGNETLAYADPPVDGQASYRQDRGMVTIEHAQVGADVKILYTR